MCIQCRAIFVPKIYVYTSVFSKNLEDTKKIISSSSQKFHYRNSFGVQCRVKYADCGIRGVRWRRNARRSAMIKKRNFLSRNIVANIIPWKHGEHLANSFPFVPLMTTLWIISSRCSCGFSIFRAGKRTRVYNRGENLDRFCPAWKQGNW